MHYLNEFDPFAAAWLRELMKDGHIPQGVVDERSIKDVVAADLVGYRQCHFFSGIGGWCEALRLAGWPADRIVWTGSCPCQPFSAAGKQKGHADDRHLWPDFFRLIRECRPDTVFGEQVPGAIGHGWLDGIQRDLEGEGYAVGHCVLGAHSVGAPHIRQRLYWVAHATGTARHGAELRDDQGRDCGGAGDGVADPERRGRGPGGTGGRGREDGGGDRLDVGPAVADAGVDGGTEHPAGDGREQRRAEPGGRGIASGCGLGGLGESFQSGLEGLAGDGHDRNQPGRVGAGETGPVAETGANGFWDRFALIPCRDGKLRRVPAGGAEPGVLGLADGLPPELAAVWAEVVRARPLAFQKVPNRVGLLRGYGNAIVPAVAALFVRAFMRTQQQGV